MQKQPKAKTKTEKQFDIDAAKATKRVIAKAKKDGVLGY